MAENDRTPRLRFKGFNDDWEWKRLGDIGVAQSGVGFPDIEQGGSVGVPFFKVSDMNRYGNERELITANNYVTEEQINRKGWKSIEGPAIFFAKVGAAVMLNRKRLVRSSFLLDNNTMAYRFGDNWDEMFGLTLFDRIDLAGLVQIGALPSYNASDVESLEICLPDKDEQECIGELFENIDRLIAVNQRKYEKLVGIKKSLLENMFPAEDESAPKIRFKGYNCGWERNNLGELGSISMCRRVFKYQTAVEGDIPFYKIGTFGGDADAFISRALFEEYKSKYPYPSKGTILISAAGSIGKTVEYDGRDEYFQDSNIVWLDYGDKITNGFLKQQYNVIKWAGIEGSTIKRLYNDNILKTEISYPDVSEQKLVADLFGCLDNLIALQKQKVDKLKDMKSALLEKMFV